MLRLACRSGRPLCPIVSASSRPSRTTRPPNARCEGGAPSGQGFTGALRRARLLADTAVSLEKQAAVIWLHEETDEPIILVAWRGSKQLEDFLLTDTTMGVILTPLPDPTLPGGSAPRPPSAPASEPMEVEAAPQSLRPMMAATEKAAPPPAADEKKPSRLRTSVQMLDDALGSLASNPPARQPPVMEARGQACVHRRPVARVCG